MRKKRPLARNVEQVRDASLVVIASEDRYAVRQYFEFFHSTRIQFLVLETNDGRSSPHHILGRLDKYIKEYQIGEGDQLWLVSDTDHWVKSGHIQNLTEVIRQCRQKGIEVAISNPCFELWLLLHFADFPNGPHLRCDEIGLRLREIVGKYNKSKIYNLPITIERVARAVERATANFAPSQVIPIQVQTAVFRVVDDLIERRLLSISSKQDV